MATEYLKKVIMSIKKEREKIWLHRPDDIRTLKKRIGSMKQNFTTVVYADTDTQSMVKYLYNLRETSKLPKIDLETLKKTTLVQLQFDQSRSTRYYDLKKTAKILKQTIRALPKVKSIKDYQALTGELLLYIGKENYWIDLEIPWKKLASTFTVRG